MSTTLHGPPARFEGGLREVAPGVHAWLQPNGSWGETNAALVAGAGESLLIDTLWTPALTRRMLDAMATVTATAPIRRLVNTHADGDHCWGNQVLADVEIVATDAAAEEMAELKPRAMAGFRTLAKVLSGPVPLPAREAGPYVTSMLRPFDFSDVELTLPTRTFEGGLTLEVGGRAVELIQVGPAHTAGDLLVHVPDARTVHAADILFAGVTPVMWAGPVERWIAALDRIAELDPEVVVPGHGPVSGLGEVRELRDYWVFVETAARERLGRGMSPEDAARDILESEGFRWASWEHPERIVVSVHTIDRHLRGDASGVSPAGRVKIFAGVGRLARQLST